MTDPIKTPTTPGDKRGLQPALLITGIFGAALGMGAIIMNAKAAAKSAPPKPNDP